MRKRNAGRPLSLSRVHFALLAIAAPFCSSAFGQPSWVQYGQDGLLHYRMDSRGDRILDFSLAGYELGVAPPSPDQVVGADRIFPVAPREGDDLRVIERAIVQAARLEPNEFGFRGIVEFAPGEYQLSDTLRIQTSGVILRGAGDGESPATNTILRSTSTEQIDLIHVDSASQTFHSLPPIGSQATIIDKVVPAGAKSLRVSNPDAFQTGDWVNVRRNATQEWLDSLGGDVHGWDVSNSRWTHHQERQITRVEGDRIFLNAPLAHNIDSRVSSGVVHKYSDERIHHVGIEGIRGVADFDASETAFVGGSQQFVDEDHAWNFIKFGKARDSWARGVTGQHFGNATVQVEGMSRSITVSDAESLDPVSEVSGGRRYAFNLNGGALVLMQDLLSDQGRHDFVNNSTFSGFNRGPNVFLNGVATNSFSDSGPHQRYATGTLYDNILESHQINARDRGSFGTGHGWSGANFVVWNSSAASFIVQNPPGSRNWLIGATGGPVLIGNTAPNASDAPGTYESIGQRVDFGDPENPLNSLYVAQRLQRERHPDLEQREYWVGDFDEFEYDGVGSHDDAYVDPDWLQAIDALPDEISDQPLTGFDDSERDRRVAFTIQYDLAPDEEVVSAVLTIATRRFGADSDDDTFWIDDVTKPITLAQTSDWGPVENNRLQVMSLELVGDIAYLQDGKLNFLLADDRGVDWAHLVVNVEPKPVPEPTSALLLIAGIAASGLASAARRRGR